MKKIIKIFIVILLFSIINVNAESIDSTKNGSISLKYSYGDKNFNNSKAYLFKIATLDENGNLTYADDFKNLNIDLGNLTTSELNALSETIDNQITQQKISPIDEQITTNDGSAQFNTLQTGIYFLRLDTVTDKDYQYKALPTLISIPLYDEVNNQYKYDLSVMVKTEAKYIGDQIDNGNTTDPPNTIDKIMIYVAIFIISLICIIGLVCYINKINKK